MNILNHPLPRAVSCQSICSLYVIFVAQKPPSFMDDLLDLSLEPDFGPSLSSLQKNPEPYKKSQNTSRVEPGRQTAAAVDEFFVMPPSTNTASNVKPDILSDSFTKIFNQQKQGTLQQQAFMPDIMTSSHHTHNSQGHGNTHSSGDFRLLNQQSLVDSPNATSSQRDTALPDLTRNNSLNNSTNQLLSAQLHNKLQQQPSQVDTSTGFLPLTEDLDFLNSYEAQRNEQIKHSVVGLHVSHSPNKSSLRSTSDKAEPTAPSFGQFSSEFSLPSAAPGGYLTDPGSLQEQTSNRESVNSVPSATNSILSANGLSSAIQSSSHSSFIKGDRTMPVLQPSAAGYANNEKSQMTQAMVNYSLAHQSSTQLDDSNHSQDSRIVVSSGPLSQTSTLSHSDFLNNDETSSNPELVKQAANQNRPENDIVVGITHLSTGESSSTNSLTQPTILATSDHSTPILQQDGAYGPAGQQSSSPLNSLNYSIPGMSLVSKTPPVSLTTDIRLSPVDQSMGLGTDFSSLQSVDRIPPTQNDPDVIPAVPSNQPPETMPGVSPASHQTVMLQGDQVAALRNRLAMAASTEKANEGEVRSIDGSGVISSHQPSIQASQLTSLSPMHTSIEGQFSHVDTLQYGTIQGPIPGLNDLIVTQTKENGLDKDHPSTLQPSVLNTSSVGQVTISDTASLIDGTQLPKTIPDVSAHPQPLTTQALPDNAEQLSSNSNDRPATDEEEFNSLLAANGYPLASNDKVSVGFTPRPPPSDVTGYPPGYESGQLPSAVGNAYNSPTGSVSSLQRYSRIRTSSVDSFTRMSYLDAQVPVDSFTALHNLAQAPRNSLLEENGIIPSNDEDMGWDIGATPNNVSEVAHVAASEQPTLQLNGHLSTVTMLTEPSMPLTNGFEPELGDAVDRPISSSRQPITEDDYHNIWDTPSLPTSYDNPVAFGAMHAIDNGFYPPSADDILNDIGISEPYSTDELPPGSVPQSSDPTLLASLGEGFLAEDSRGGNFVPGAPEDVYNTHLQMAQAG